MYEDWMTRELIYVIGFIYFIYRIQKNFKEFCESRDIDPLKTEGLMIGHLIITIISNVLFIVLILVWGLAALGSALMIVWLALEKLFHALFG